eukprot:13191-Prymnesium_polylepis.1
MPATNCMYARGGTKNVRAATVAAAAAVLRARGNPAGGLRAHRAGQHRLQSRAAAPARQRPHGRCHRLRADRALQRFTTAPAPVRCARGGLLRGRPRNDGGAPRQRRELLAQQPCHRGAEDPEGARSAARWSRRTACATVIAMRILLRSLPPAVTVRQVKTDMQGHDFLALSSAGAELRRVHYLQTEVWFAKTSTYEGARNDFCTDIGCPSCAASASSSSACILVTRIRRRCTRRTCATRRRAMT